MPDETTPATAAQRDRFGPVVRCEKHEIDYRERVRCTMCVYEDEQQTSPPAKQGPRLFSRPDYVPNRAWR